MLREAGQYLVEDVVAALVARRVHHAHFLELQTERKKKEERKKEQMNSSISTCNEKDEPAPRAKLPPAPSRSVFEGKEEKEKKK